MKCQYYSRFAASVAALLVTACTGLSQVQTVGLFVNDTARTWKGYTLFAPKHNTATYLINNDGQMVHKWSRSQYEPGQSVYLLPNGHLLRSCMTKGPLSTGGGEGGRIEEYDWNDSLVWQFDYSTAAYMQHHDIRPLPNGNVLVLAVEKKTLAELLAAGFDPSKYQPDVTQKGYLLPEFVVEVVPARPLGGTVIWEWHVWDHLIQDYDATKLNYGIVADHPELIDADGDGKQLPSFWNHANAVNYNPAFDQIILSIRGNSEVWVIDHTTTTVEAQGHSGGKRGKGGDLLYRWGNPICYKAGTSSDQKLFQQHDAQWIPPGCPGAGNIMCFDNGLGRNYSTIDEFTPPVDSEGNYAHTAGMAFGPASYTWSYVANPPTALYSEAISGAQRLPNGNTLIDDGVHGTFLEVAYAGETVWKYVNPVVLTGPLNQGDIIPDDPARVGEKMNGVFRVARYPLDYAGLLGKDLAPKGFVEVYPTSVGASESRSPELFALSQNYPNPFNPTTVVSSQLSVASEVRIVINDLLGREVSVLVNQRRAAGRYEDSFDAHGLASGVYICRMTAGTFVASKRMILLK